MDGNKLYSIRFSDRELQRKRKIWLELCERFFQRYIKPTDTVLDLGAGNCEFINQIKCSKKIAVDISPDTRQFANSDIRVIVSSGSNMTEVETSSVDVVFASNFFEHLKTKGELLQTFTEIWRVLRIDGRLLILQPNIRYTGGKYWDFFDHYLPITDRMLIEVFGLVGFQQVEVRPRFLPYTTKSNLPQLPILTRIYLSLPFVQFLLGEQAWIVGKKIAIDRNYIW